MRRMCLCLTIGLALASCPAARAAEESATPFFPMDTAIRNSLANLDLVKELGYDGAGWSEQEPEQVRHALAEMEKRGLRMFMIYCGASVNAAGALEFSPRLPAIMEALKGKGTTIWLPIRGKGPDFKTLAADAPVVAGLRALAEKAKANALRVAIYPHVGDWTARFGDATTLAKLVAHPDLGVVFTLCHSLAMGDEARLPALLEAAKPVLISVAINGADAGLTGADWNRLIQPLGKGTLDVAAIVHKIRSLGYAGPIGFQGYGIQGDIRAMLGQTMDAWKRMAPTPVHAAAPAPTEADPYAPDAVAADLAAGFRAVMYTKDNAPATPALEALPLVGSVSHYGITWTFDKPARAGRFVNGDWYVVGPTTVVALDPAPRYGAEIPNDQLDRMDKERKEAERVRNGFMRNPPARMEVAYDSGVRNWFNPELIQKLPAALEPGDALVATISMPKGLVLKAPLRNKIERGVDDSSPIRTAAVLTCVRAPLPPDAFRPSFCDRGQEIFLARDLRRESLPAAKATKSLPSVELYTRFTQRPWVGTGFFGFEEPVENMPQYGLEYGRVSGISALLLCTDLAPERKEPLLLNFVQIGIDLGGIVHAGHPGWSGWGGHGSGRKLPIVFAGLLLGDPELAAVTTSFPKASFGEDEQTAYGACWTGATVVFAGHSGIDAATGIGRNRGRGNAWGPYEHTPPTQWREDQQTSEAYRRCCTSVGWVAQALALRLLHAEGAWGHDAFFDYVDRWMYENDAEFVRKIKEATGKDHDKEWARQGQAWDAFVNEMWAAHRPTLAAPCDGWKKPHDDGYYRAAIEKSRR